MPNSAKLVGSRTGVGEPTPGAATMVVPQSAKNVPTAVIVDKIAVSVNTSPTA